MLYMNGVLLHNQGEAMTLEILEDGGARITGREDELVTLVQNAELALRAGIAHAPFLTENGVSEFLIELEKPPSEVGHPEM
jgi:hypothetical protein